MSPFKRTRVPLLMVVLVACGVSSGCRSVWVHPQWDQERYREDLGACADTQSWKQCMEAKGWEAERGWIWSPRTRTPTEWYEVWW